MLLMKGKGIRGHICYAIHRYAKGNNKYIKNNAKKKEYLVFKCKHFVWMGNVSKITWRWF